MSEATSTNRRPDARKTAAEARHRPFRKPVLWFLTSLLAAALLFAWGYLAHRNKVFPYHLARDLAVEAGLLPPQPTVPGVSPNVAVATMMNIPYVAGTADPEADRSGVVHHEPELVHPGWNLFSPRLHPRAFLVAMDGRVGHRWRADSGSWQHVELMPDGGLLALVKDDELIRMDVDSRILWRYPEKVHHDLDVDGDGTIHTLARHREVVPEIHPTLPTVVDRVIRLSPDGEFLGEISLLHALLRSPYRFLLPNLELKPESDLLPAIDILHANHVEVLDGRLGHLSPIYRKGNLLISARTIHAIFILDPDSGEIVFLWGPSNLARQHHPTVLADGNLLMFNNRTELSEVLELDPLELRVEWRYEANDFFSLTRGSVQRLPNGNTLITESDTGYVFEVTSDGERVWIFANPFFAEKGVRMAMWRMTRFFPGDPRLPKDLPSPAEQALGGGR